MEIDGYRIDTKGATSGNIKIPCPKCAPERGNPNDPSLSVNLDNGVWYCHHCRWKGNVNSRKKTYITPTPPAEKVITEDGASFLASRCISLSTANRHGIYSGYDGLYFPLYRNGELINIKRRFLSKKDFSSVKGAEVIVFGYDDIQGDEVYIVEGEMDKLALEECGVQSVMSVPGATAFKSLEDSYRKVRECERIFLAGDWDKQGTPLMQKVAKDIGAEKCLKVLWPEGCKDANDTLMKFGKEKVGECIYTATPLPFKAPKVHKSHVYLVDDMIRAYKSHTENLKVNTLKTGVTKIDNHIRGVAPGEVLTIIARAGTFKTALLQNILLNHAEKTNSIAAFFSLEMPVPMVFERYVQMLESKKGREVEKAYLNNKGETLSRQAITRLSNIAIVPKKVSLKNIAEYIPIIEKKSGKKVSVIGIDYLGLIDARGESEYMRNSSIATGTKDLAKEVNLPVVMLSQVKRPDATGGNEVHVDGARGSGAIEEGADFILAMWQDEGDLICAIRKNRKGIKDVKFKLTVFPEYMQFHKDCDDYVEKISNKYNPDSLV